MAFTFRKSLLLDVLLATNILLLDVSYQPRLILVKQRLR